MSSDWNAFDQAPAAEVQHRERLGDICGSELDLGMGLKVKCRKSHSADDRECEAFMNAVTDDKVVRLTWRRV